MKKTLVFLFALFSLTVSAQFTQPDYKDSTVMTSIGWGQAYPVSLVGVPNNSHLELKKAGRLPVWVADSLNPYYVLFVDSNQKVGFGTIFYINSHIADSLVNVFRKADSNNPKNPITYNYFNSHLPAGDSGIVGSSSVNVTHAKPRVVSLPNSGVTPGAGNYVTVNNKGIVTAVIDSIIQSGSNVTISRAGGSITISATNPYSDTLPTGKLLTGTKGLQVGGQKFNTSSTAFNYGSTDSSQLNLKVNNRKSGLISMAVPGNTSWGYGALQNLTIFSDTVNLSTGTGNYNTAIGVFALANINGQENHMNPNEYGINNVGVGSYALWKQHYGWDNIGIGKYSGLNDTGSVANVLIGTNVGLNQKSGRQLNVSGDRYGVAVGYDALYGAQNARDSASYFAVLGSRAADSITGTAFFTTAVGYQAIAGQVLTGPQNTAIGSKSVFNNTSGSNNTGLGYEALYYNTTGSQNTAMGSFALGFGSGSNHALNNCTAVGYQALYNTQLGNNDALGYTALFSNTTGVNNVGIGESAAYFNTTGSRNTAIGQSPLMNGSGGSSNTAVGLLCLMNAGAGTKNIGVGDSCFYNATGATLCIGIGYQNTLKSATDTKEIVIGSQTVGNGSNTITLGGKTTLYTLIHNGVADSSGVPAITAGAGAGSGLLSPVVSDTGTNLSGTIVVTTGTTTTTGAICTITFANSLSFPNGSGIQLTPGNAATALLSGATMVYITSSKTQFIINSGSSALVGAGTTYVWKYANSGY